MFCQILFFGNPVIPYLLLFSKTYARLLSDYILAASNTAEWRILMAISENVTISQIAEKAKVSTATASRVINQPGTVKEETRNRVLQAMKELNYQTKRSDHKILLASFSDFVNPFYSECITGMQTAARRRDYQLFLQQIDNTDNPAAYDNLINSKVFQGIIFCHSVPSGETLDSLRMKYPIVMCSQYNDETDIPYVAIDDYESAWKAVSYLAATGRKKIAFINSSLNHSYSRLREKGYREALLAAGLLVREEWIAHLMDISFDIAYSIAHSLLSAADIPDAIFCASDVFACAAVKAAHTCNLDIPADIAIMGFDNVNLTNMTFPTISTVNQPAYQMGYQSCNLLIDQIENPSISNRAIIMATDIVVRAST